MTTNEPATPTLTCLKCGGAMRTYERSGVLIDQCTECRGIFLDRGELDRIVDAESSPDRVASANGADRRPADDVRRPAGERHARVGGDDDRWDGDGDDDRRPSRGDRVGRPPGQQERKRSSLLGNVIDILGGGE